LRYIRREKEREKGVKLLIRLPEVSGSGKNLSNLHQYKAKGLNLPSSIFRPHSRQTTFYFFEGITLGGHFPPFLRGLFYRFFQLPI
jgi:hypothetical protein